MALALVGLSAGAQEMMWENVTGLHLAATGGTDPVPQMF